MDLHNLKNQFYPESNVVEIKESSKIQDFFMINSPLCARVGTHIAEDWVELMVSRDNSLVVVCKEQNIPDKQKRGDA